jgi:type II secretory pathway component PulK
MGSGYSAGKNPVTMSILTRSHMSEVTSQKRKSGAAIMLALWALFLLSAMVISWALDIDSRLSISGEGMRVLKAEAAACSGSEIALHPFVNPGSSNLSGQVQSGASYEARLTGEGGRIDINWIAAPPDDEGKIGILRRYLENKGIDMNERDTMIDALLDWVQPSAGLHRLNAPPESENYHPPHLALAHIEDLKQVAGWADFTAQPGWSDDFTLYSSKQGIDLAWASRDVLAALPGLTPEAVDRFLELRKGPDGIDGTEDDAQFKTIDDVGLALGLNRDQLDVLKAVHNNAGNGTPLVCFKQDRRFRVSSVGTAGNAKRTVEMIFAKGGTGAGGSPQILSWREF